MRYRTVRKTRRHQKVHACCAGRYGRERYGDFSMFWPAATSGLGRFGRLELELDLMQSYMAQVPMLRGEVGARALRVRSVSREEAWASAGVRCAWVSGCFRCGSPPTFLSVSRAAGVAFPVKGLLVS